MMAPVRRTPKVGDVVVFRDGSMYLVQNLRKDGGVGTLVRMIGANGKPQVATPEVWAKVQSGKRV